MFFFVPASVISLSILIPFSSVYKSIFDVLAGISLFFICNSLHGILTLDILWVCSDLSHYTLVFSQSLFSFFLPLPLPASCLVNSTFLFFLGLSSSVVSGVSSPNATNWFLVLCTCSRFFL